MTKRTQSPLAIRAPSASERYASQPPLPAPLSAKRTQFHPLHQAAQFIASQMLTALPPAPSPPLSAPNEPITDVRSRSPIVNPQSEIPDRQSAIPRAASRSRPCYSLPMARSIAAILVLTVLPGCAVHPLPTGEQKKLGAVYILPGIEGRSYANRNIARGLKRGGVMSGISIFDWTTRIGFMGWYTHLTDTRRNRIEATRLARIILRYQRTHSDRPVTIIAHSGGTGIAVMAVEMLAKDRPIDAVILLAAALSPQRDLTRALMRTRRGIWNFYSPRDVGFLILGTSLFGTIDRKYGAGAGAVGFEVPDGSSEATAALYAGKLVQVRYHESMADDGNPGTHTGWTSRRFVARWLAPIVLEQDGPADALHFLEPYNAD